MASFGLGSFGNTLPVVGADNPISSSLGLISNAANGGGGPLASGMQVANNGQVTPEHIVNALHSLIASHIANAMALIHANAAANPMPVHQAGGIVASNAALSALHDFLNGHAANGAAGLSFHDQMPVGVDAHGHTQAGYHSASTHAAVVAKRSQHPHAI